MLTYMAKDLLLHIPHKKRGKKSNLFQLLKFVVQIAALTEFPSWGSRLAQENMAACA